MPRATSLLPLAAVVLLAGCPKAELGSGACRADGDCGSGQSCSDGVCVACPPCAAGEACIAGICLPALCGDLACRPGQGCLNGRCVDGACLRVACPAGQACARGACYPQDCGALDCSQAEVCFNDACVSSACIGVSCGGGETCVNGRCVSQSCTGVQCAQGSACMDGRCVAVACVGVSCPEGSVCGGGRCLPSSGAGCPAPGCPAGKACQSGRCRDASCIDAVCEPGSRCYDGACVACSGGVESACADGEDEDCDGSIDCDDSDCASSSSCGCPQVPCGPAEHCVGGHCLPASCGAHPCHAGEGCRDGVCIASDCLATACASDEACARGTCLPKDCPGTDCAPGEVCVDGAWCVYTGCVGKLCGGGEVCADGRCLPQDCGGTPCANGAACEGGACLATGCIGVTCPEGSVCSRGTCLPTTGPGCPAEGCPAGLACVGGACGWHDCDGLSCPGGQVCVAGACEPAAASETSCTDGRDNDGNGQLDCQDPACGEVTPCRCLAVASELSCADGVDDDCDDLVDCEDPDCAAAPVCTCPAVPCGAGNTCVGNTCLPASCGAQPCHAGEGCKDGSCVAADCLTTTCVEGQACVQGTCLPKDCPGAACAAGEVCVNDAWCTYTGCVGKLCGAGEVCADGRCLPHDCGDKECAAGAACAGGACLATSCIGISCPGGTLCSRGLCLPTAGPGCPVEGCPSGQACVSGSCGWHDCDGLSCPAGQVCVAGACEAAAASETSCTDGRDNDGDGRLDCQDPACAVACHCPAQAAASETECADGIDDDCDGQLDCADPECAGAPACGCPLVPCAAGEHCVGGTCLPASCGDHPCHAGEGCKDGLCVGSECLATTCGAAQACARGICLPEDCPGADCAAGEVCLNGSSCVYTGCVGVLCGGGEVCADGRCLPQACGATSCAIGAACEGGRCLATSCIGIACPGGTVCSQGRCLPTSGPGCPAEGCPSGQACANGACGWHDCDGLTCPSGRVCVAGACEPAAATETSCTDGRDNDGNGQLDCQDPACGEVVPCRCLAHATETRCADGIDDDCDALLDCADPDCATSASCRCPIVPCAAGENCVGGTCLPASCGDHPCHAGEGCQDGNCVAADCLATTCGADEACAKGVCLPKDCPGTDCAPGDVCVYGSSCVYTGCVSTPCGSGEVCADGRCLPRSCGGATCATGAACDGGECLAASCIGISCPSDTVCAQGRCLPTTGPGCPAEGCPSGQACVAGACGWHDCDGLTCPGGQVCVAGACEPAAASETHCSDGRDEDGNGLLDCADPACGYVAPCRCLTHASEINCEDGVDDDCDGQLDCADPDCLDAACGAITACGRQLCGPGGTCEARLELAGTVCRPRAGPCDLEEACSGSGPDCPPDASGPCTPAVLVISDGPTLDFGGRLVGTSSTWTFTVTNVGGWEATLGMAEGASLGLATPFARTGGTCASNAAMPPGESCTLVVSYAPSLAGVWGDSVELAYDDGVSTQIASVAVAGSAHSPALLTLSHGPAFDFGPRVLGSGTAQTFTVANSGGWQATLGTVDDAGLGLAAPFARAGGTCATGATLAPAGSCTLVVTFTPAAAGPASHALGLSYDDGTGTRTATRALAGSGAAPAVLSLSDGPTYDFGAHALGSSTARSLTVTNTGAWAATLGTVSDAGLGLAAPFSLAGGTCATGLSLAAAGSCTLVVAFAPTAAGEASAVLGLDYDDGAGARNATRALLGTGVAAGTAALSISDGPAYDFGSRVVGTTAARTFTVVSSGGAAAVLGTVSDAGLGLAPPYSLTGGSCSSGASLASGDSCTLIVSFSPATNGAASDWVTMSYDDGSSPRTATRAVTGLGVNPGQLLISDAPSFDFGLRPTGSSLPKTFLVTNTGEFPAALGTVTDLGLGLASPFALAGGSCVTGAAIPPGGNCTLSIRFAPTASGVSNDTLELPYDDGAAARIAARPLTGAGADPAVLLVSDGPSFDYGALALGAGAVKAFTVTNSGGWGAVLGTVTSAGLGLSAPYALAGGTCAAGAWLAPADSCTLLVRFAPDAPGATGDGIELGYDDGGATRVAARAISGTGAPPALLVLSDAPAFDFGTRPIGSTATRSVTVTNTGGFAATLGAVSDAGLGLASPFALTPAGTCASGAPLPSGGSCTLVVRFTPTDPTPASDALGLAYHDGAASRSVALSLAGGGAPPALLTLSGGPTLAFGTVALGASATRTLTVTNSGGVAATLGTVSGEAVGLASPYALAASGTCATGDSLAPGSSCTLGVTFAPTDPGPAVDSLELAYDDGVAARAASRELSGSGASPALLVFSEGPTFDFGTRAVGSTATATLTVTNGGSFAAALGTVSDAGLGLAFPYTLVGGSCATGASLAPDSSCTLVVGYAPGSAGASSSALALGYEDGAASRTATCTLAGTGAPPAVLSFSEGPAYDFGPRTIGSSASRSFAVTNTGSFAATLGSVTGAGLGLAAPFALSGGTCATGASLAPDAGCTLVVAFAPTSASVAGDTLDLGFHDGANASVATLALSGAGTSPALLGISDAPSHDFGTLPLGSAATWTFTVTNSGGAPATLGTVSGAALGLAEPFALTGGSCTSGASLASSGGSCTLVVRYTPTSATASNATLTLPYADGAAGGTATRALTGTGAHPALLALSDGPTFDYGTRAIGSKTSRTFTVSNLGGLSATLGDVSDAGLGLAFPYALSPGGSCSTGLSLPPGASCTAIVGFEPFSEGPSGDSIDLGYHDGGTSRTASRALAGAGALPGLLSFSEAPTYDYGVLATGASSVRTFTVTNSGHVAAVLGAVADGAAVGLAPPFTLAAGGTCTTGLSLAPGASCTLSVRFSPTSAGYSGDGLELSYQDGATTRTTSCTLGGVGAAPAVLALSDGPTYDFGTQPLGSSATKTFVVTNAGGLAATLGTLSGASLGLASPFALAAGGSCATGASLTPSSTCTLVVRFAPTSAGLFAEAVELPYQDGAASRLATGALTGTGASPALLTLSDGPSYDFGTRAVGAAGSRTFTVSNSGGFAATLGPITGAGLGLAAPYTLEVGGTCASGASLAAGSSCTLVLGFAPTGSGVFNDTVAVGYHDGSTDQIASRPLTGRGATPAVLTLSGGPTYDFGTRALGSSGSATFTVANSGEFAATLGTVTSAGLGLASPYTLDAGSTCATGAALAAGGSCTLVVTYAPSATGASPDSLDLGYQDGASSRVVSRALTGTGANPALLALSDGPSYSFGTLARGASTTKSFTVTNTGAFAATLGTVSDAGLGLAAPFALTGGTCASGAVLAPAGACTLVVTFAPTSAGPFSGALGLGYHDGAATKSASGGVTGTGANPALLGISDAPSYAFGLRTVGSVTITSFAVTNTGGFAATLGTVSDAGLGLAPPFTLEPGGTCATGASLAPGASCDLIVRYAPTTPGADGDSIDLSYHDGAFTTSTSRPLSGTGVNPAVLSISDGPTWSFGTRAVGSTTSKTLVVTNSGGSLATLETVTTAALGLAAPYALTGGTCATNSTLAAAGGSCTLVVSYTPTASGASSDSLDLAYKDGAVPRTVSRALTGTAATPALLALSDGPTWPFGTLALGASGSKTFTVTNTGGVAATLGTVTTAALGLAAPYALAAGGTCATGLLLSPSETCTLVVTYAPAATGPTNDSIDLGYANGVGTQTASRGVSGTGANPAALGVSDGPTWSFGTLAVGTSATKSFTVTNSGGVAATLGTVSDAGLGLAAPYALAAGGTCTTGASLVPSGTCTLIVRYAPTAAGAASEAIDLGYQNGVSAQVASRPLTGTGAAPALLSLSDGPTYDFGTRAQGSSATRTFTVTNSGGVSAVLGTVSTAALGLAGPYALAGGTCATGSSLAAAGGACTLVVTFAPAATGTFNDAIELPYPDGVSSQIAARAVTGTSVSPAFLSLSDGPSYDFGTRAVGASGTKTFTVTNTGAFSATLGSIDTVGLGLASPFAFTPGGTCATGATLAPAATCTLVVSYTPTAAVASGDFIDLAYQNGATSQTASRSLTGTGAAPAVLSLSDGPAFGFGTLATGASAAKTFTVTNTGSFAATLGTVTGAGLGLAAPYALTGGTCATGSTLAPAGTCTLIVGYLPTVTGASSDSLDVAYHDGAANRTSSRSLSGTGASPALLSLSDGPTYDFGSRALGSSATRSLTVTNSGGFAATLGPVTSAGLALAEPYALAGGTCATGATLAPAGTCTLVVRFAPTALGSASDTVTLAYDDGAASQAASRPLAGTGASPALLSISDGSTYTYGTRAVGSTTTKTFTLANLGGYPATLGTIDDATLELAAPFTRGAGSTCTTGLTLAPAASCDLLIRFAPAAPGDFTDAFTVGYDDGASSQTATRPITGSGAAPANLTAAGFPFDFGGVAVDSSTSQTFTVTNVGDFPATLGSMTSAGLGLGGPYALAGGTCATGSSLAPGASCTLSISFSPTGNSNYSSVFNVPFNDGAAPRSLTLTVSGTGYFAPVNTAAPTIIGSPPVRQLLRANPGGWTGSSPLAYAYQWQRCDAGGNACVDLPTATQMYYRVAQADAGGTLRVRVTATNSVGTETALSAPTALVVQGGETVGIDGRVYSVTVRPDGKRVVAGEFNAAGGTLLSSAARFNPDGSWDPTYVPMGTGASDSIYAAARDSQGRLVIGGSFTDYDSVPRRYLARLLPDGTLDPTLMTEGTGFNNWGTISALAIDSSGRIVVGGSFSSYNGVPRGKVARLHPDGTLDTSFATTGTGFNNSVLTLAIDPATGKIVVGGYFTSYNGTARPYVARLNVDGTLDTTFVQTGTGLNQVVRKLRVDSSSRVTVAGGFTNYNGTSRSQLARLTSTGALDPTFAIAGTGFNAAIYAIELDGSDRVLVGGYFTSYNGTPRQRIARLTSTGALDGTFTHTGTGLNGSVGTIALDTTGILIAGGFSSYDGTLRPGMAKLTTTGGLDLTFAPTPPGVASAPSFMTVDESGRVIATGSFRSYSSTPVRNLALLDVGGALDPSFVQEGTGFDDYVMDVASDATNRIVVGGIFFAYNGQPRSCIARLNSNGTLDTTFVQTGAGLDNEVRTLAVDASDRVVVGGQFWEYDGTPQPYLARINADGSFDATFRPTVDDQVTEVVIDSSQRIVAAGWFASPQPYLARFNPDGTVDPSFAQTGTGLDDWAYAVAIDPVGNLVVGGYFTAYNGIPRGGIARLRPDGSLDPSFVPPALGFDSLVEAIALDSAGRILVGGPFRNYGGVSRNCLARLHPDGSLDTMFEALGTGFNRQVADVAIDAAGRVIVGGLFTAYDGLLARGYWEMP